MSVAIAALFGQHAQAYRAAATQAALIHDQFVTALGAGGAAHTASEVLGVVNAPTQALLGRPLIADGANATTAGGNGVECPATVG